MPLFVDKNSFHAPQFSSEFCCAVSLSLIYSWAEECSWWPFAKMPPWREPIYLHGDERSLKIMEKAEIHYKGKCYLCMRIVIWWFRPEMWVMVVQWATALMCMLGATYTALLRVTSVCLCQRRAFVFEDELWVRSSSRHLYQQSPTARLCSTCKEESNSHLMILNYMFYLTFIFLYHFNPYLACRDIIALFSLHMELFKTSQL